MANWELPRAMDEFEYRGIETVFLENEHLRVMVLPGKGGDVLEFREKRTGTDVLYHADHNWQPPTDRPIPTGDARAWHDTYPGGWQVNVPVAGYTDDFYGTPYGLHGESALLPFEYDVRELADSVELHMSVDLVRYPFRVERTLTLPAGEPTLRVAESITNEGTDALPYMWQHHLALGAPLLGSSARVDVPAETGVVHDYGPDHENNRLSGGETFDWPVAPTSDGEVDLREVPGEDATVHDVAYAIDLNEGWFALTNLDRDLTFGYRFPEDVFEAVWYWQALHGHAETPYFGRNYNVGLEPTTAYPSGDIPEAQEETGTMRTLEAGETVSADFTATTAPAADSVTTITDSGEIREQN